MPDPTATDVVRKAIERWSDERGGHPPGRDADAADLAACIVEALSGPEAVQTACPHQLALETLKAEVRRLLVREGRSFRARGLLATGFPLIAALLPQDSD